MMVVRTHNVVICHVLHSLGIGGAEILARQFAERSKGQVISIFACLDELGELGADLRKQGYYVEVIGRRPGFDYSLPRRLHRIFKNQKVSVVHAHQYAPFFYSSLARIPFRTPPIIFTEHGRSFPDFRRPKRVVANRFLLGRRDRIVAVGDQVRQALIDNEGFSPSRVEVVHNGVPVEKFEKTNEARWRARQTLSVQDSEFIIVQVARLNALKDHLTAVAAMAILAKSFPQARLLLVGEGEERPAIEAAIAANELQRIVKLVGARNDVVTYLHAADAFLLSSVSEGIPLTLIEAMSAEIACVSTAVGGIPEVIEHGRTGMLAPSKDAALLAEYLNTLVAKPEIRHQLAAEAKARAISQFSDNSMHSQYQKMYSELAKN